MQLELCGRSCEPVAPELEEIGRVPDVRQNRPACPGVPWGLPWGVHGQKNPGDPDFLPLHSLQLKESLV
jgi:hypothetical protein